MNLSCFKLFAGDANEDDEGRFVFTLSFRSWLHGSVQRNHQVKIFYLFILVIHHHHHHHLCPLRLPFFSQGGIQSGQCSARHQHPRLCLDPPFSSPLLPPSSSSSLHSTSPALPPAVLPPSPCASPAHPVLHGCGR